MGWPHIDKERTAFLERLADRQREYIGKLELEIKELKKGLKSNGQRCPKDGRK